MAFSRCLSPSPTAGTTSCGSLNWDPATSKSPPVLADQLNANKAKFADNPTMLADLTQLKELYDLGCMGKNALSDAYADRTKVMASGKVAMTVMSTGFPAGSRKRLSECQGGYLGLFRDAAGG